MARHSPKKKQGRGPTAKKARARPRRTTRGGARASPVAGSRRAGGDNPRTGSSLDDLLREEGLFEELTAAAVKETIAWQIARAMKGRGINKTEMAAAMGTSRAQLDRLLDPQNESVTLATLLRAARALGVELRIELRPLTGE